MSSKIDLVQVLKAYDYAECHPHKYLRGTTNWAAAVAHSLNEQAAPVVERQPAMLWSDYERISDIKAVDGALRAFSEDATGDNAVCVVRAIVENTAPPELAELQALSVTNIMLDVVPGDGSGHEVYAKSVADVEGKLSKQGDEIEELQATIAQLQAEIERFKTALGDSEQVFINLKTGSIAKPTLRSMIDLYGEVVNGEDAQLLEIGKLRAEIERLKSGQGEPVGIVTHRVDDIGQSFEGVIYATPILMGLVQDGTLLYASQPEPASEGDKS